MSFNIKICGGSFRSSKRIYNLLFNIYLYLEIGMIICNEIDKNCWFFPFASIFYKDLIPITIFGYIQIVDNILLNSTSFSLTLISRRSIYRNGRRFNTRGVDEEGNVANYVETEQIIHTSDNIVYSHVQVV